MFLGGLAVTATADEGSLELNEQMIYDDGYQDDTLQKKQASAPVVQAEKKIFTHREHSSKQIQQKNQQVLRKYLFTKRSKLKVVPGDKKGKTSELAGFKYLWSTLLFVKRKESNSRWTNN